MMNRQKLLLGIASMAVFVISLAATPAMAQQSGPIELETIEIESEVPRRVAQFFVQRDRLHYQPVDDQPTFLPELLNSVSEDPF